MLDVLCREYVEQMKKDGVKITRRSERYRWHLQRIRNELEKEQIREELFSQSRDELEEELVQIRKERKKYEEVEKFILDSVCMQEWGIYRECILNKARVREQIRRYKLQLRVRGSNKQVLNTKIEDLTKRKEMYQNQVDCSLRIMNSRCLELSIRSSVVFVSLSQ